MTFIRKSERTHTKLGKGSYDTGAPYGAGFAGVTTRGLSTGPIPYGPHGSAAFDISFDLLDNRLAVTTSDDGGFYFALDDLTVAEFYRRLFDGLRSLGIEAAINTKPFALDDEYTLDANTIHCVCEQEYVQRYHRVLLWV